MSRPSQTTVTSRAATSTHRPDLPGGRYWGDIIPPYEYIDSSGKVQTFPAQNWNDQDRRSTRTAASRRHPQSRFPSRRRSECVEALDGGQFLAHHGYCNPNANDVEPPPDRTGSRRTRRIADSRTAFASGRVADAFQVQWSGGDLTWRLMGNELTVSSGSTPV